MIRASLGKLSPVCGSPSSRVKENMPASGFNPEEKSVFSRQSGGGLVVDPILLSDPGRYSLAVAFIFSLRPYAFEGYDSPPRDCYSASFFFNFG